MDEYAEEGVEVGRDDGCDVGEIGGGEDERDDDGERSSRLEYVEDVE